MLMALDKCDIFPHDLGQDIAALHRTLYTFVSRPLLQTSSHTPLISTGITQRKESMHQHFWLPVFLDL